MFSFFFLLSDPPSVQVFTLNATDGDQVNLTCVADGQPQTYTYRWQHLWGEMVIREFPESEYIPGHSVLTLDNITYEDSGTYRCLADNGIPDRLGDKTQSGVGDFLVKGMMECLCFSLKNFNICLCLNVKNETIPIIYIQTLKFVFSQTNTSIQINKYLFTWIDR